MFATIALLVSYLAIPFSLAIAALFGLWSQDQQEPLPAKYPSRQGPRRRSSSR
jgi:hypothetical protein